MNSVPQGTFTDPARGPVQIPLSPDNGRSVKDVLDYLGASYNSTSKIYVTANGNSRAATLSTQLSGGETIQVTHATKAG